MKKLTALIVALMLVLAILPAAALAATAPVGGTPDVTVDGRVVAPGEAITLAKGGWASLSVDGSVLTLNNANLSVFADAGMVSYNKALTILLVGSNTISYKGNDDYVFGVMVGGDLKIKGSGSLNIELLPQTDASSTAGIFALGNIDIEDATIYVSAIGGTVDGIYAVGNISTDNANVTSYVTSYTKASNTNVMAMAAGSGDSDDGAMGDISFEGSHIYTSAISTVGNAYGVIAGNIGMKRTYVSAAGYSYEGDAYGLYAMEDLSIKVACRLDLDALADEGLAAGACCKGVADISNSRIDADVRAICQDDCDSLCSAIGLMFHYSDFFNSKVKVNAYKNCVCTKGTVAGISADYLGVADTALTVNASADSFVQGNAGMELKQLVIDGSSVVRVNGNLHCDGVLLDYGRSAFTIEDGKLIINTGRLGLAGLNCDMLFNGGYCDINGGIAAIVGANDGYSPSYAFARRVGLSDSGINFAFDADGCFTLVKNGSPFGIFVTDGAITAVTGAASSARIAYGYTNAPVKVTIAAAAVQ